MRATIEITAEQRARLRALAARRGERSFSPLVREAIDAFLRAEATAYEKGYLALTLRGALARIEAERLREATRAMRGSWRD